MKQFILEFKKTILKAWGICFFIDLLNYLHSHRFAGLLNDLVSAIFWTLVLILINWIIRKFKKPKEEVIK